MRLLKWGTKMSPNKYNLVPNDESDTRIPLHSDEAFTVGITFHAKYIGTMDVPRPTSRVEIVDAMRRIRYEFKAKGVKKKKVTVEISVDGVRVSVRKKKVAKKKEGSKLFGGGGGGEAARARAHELLHHPIYRIFYVSHDSSDLKIFSYIARDGATNLFKCSVFKSNKKSQAMRIVRTVGQAFDVCHKMSSSPEPPASVGTADESACASASGPPPEPPPSDREAVSESGASWGEAVSAAVASTSTGATARPERPQKLELLPPPPRKERRSPQRSTPTPSPSVGELVECAAAEPGEAGGETPLGAHHELQLLRERLSQQSQQTRAAVAQLLLLRDQLAAEQAARCEAQARTHQLLVHNKELLDHITALVAHLQERERGSRRPPPISVQQLTMVPQQQPNATKAQDASLGSALVNRNIPDHAAILDLISNNPLSASVQNLQNNNTPFSTFGVSPSTPINGQNHNTPFATFDVSPSKTINGHTFNTTFPTFDASPSTINGQNHNTPFSTFDVSPLKPINGQIHNAVFPTFDTSPSTINWQNNNTPFSSFTASPVRPSTPVNGLDTFHYSDASAEQLIAQFQSMGGYPPDALACNLQFYQNCNAFPNIPPLASRSSDPDLASFAPPSRASEGLGSLAPSPAGSEREDVEFIMPLSHAATLAATGADGRLRLIVPVSPSGSSAELAPRAAPVTLNVTDERGVTRRALPLAPPVITRTTSEKVPNRSEMMSTMRAQWTRHTTK